MKSIIFFDKLYKEIIGSNLSNSSKDYLLNLILSFVDELNEEIMEDDLND